MKAMAAGAATGLTEADWILWLGIALSVTGTMVSAANGVVVIAAAVGRWVTLAATSARRWIRIHILRQRVGVNIRAVPATASASSTARLVGAGTVWDPNADVETRVELVHQEVQQLRDELGTFREEVTIRQAAASRSVEELRAAQDTHERAVDERLRLIERDAARVNAWGFPLLGWGIIMVGIPSPLAHVAGIGWGFIAVACVGIVVGLKVIVRAGRAKPH